MQTHKSDGFDAIADICSYSNKLTLSSLMRVSVSFLISMARMILSSAPRSELCRMSEISIRVD